jgi:hypothetical protein
VASALHQYSSPYLLVVSIILNAMDPQDVIEAVGYKGFSDQMGALVKHVVACL